MIGRLREVATLREAFDAAGSGAGAIVDIVGPAGIGKSRLVAEARAASDGISWLDGRALSFSRTLAYWPLIEIVRRWAEIVDLDDTLDSWVKLNRATRNLAGDDAVELVPYLSALLGIPVPAELAERVRYLDGQGMRHQIMLTTRRWLEHLARRTPVVLVVEDVHWLDRASADVIAHLLPLVETVPLVVCLVGREDHDTSGAALRAAGRGMAARYTELVLAPLPREDMLALTAALLGAAAAPAERDALAERAEGNPGRAEDIVYGIHADIASRLDRLDEELGRALKLDVVVGPGFLSRTLTTIAEADDALERHLAAGARSDAAVLRERLRELHGRVGECVETLFADRIDELSALLAYHFARGESWTVAKDYLYLAGDHASKLAADTEAVALYRRALELHDRVLGAAWDPVERAVLHRKMGEALWRRGDNDDAADYFQRALTLLGQRPLPASRAAVRRGIVRELAVHVGRRVAARLRRRPAEDEDLRAPARRPGTAEREVVTIYSRLVWIDYFRSSERFLYDLLVLLSRSESWGHGHGTAEAEAGLGVVCDVIVPARALARRYHVHAVAMAEATENPVLLGFAHLCLGLHNYYRGHWNDAIARFETSAASYRAGGEIRGWASAEQMIAWILRLQGKFAASVERSRAIVRVAEDAADSQAAAFALHGIAWTAWHTGDLDAAVASLADVIGRYTTVGNDQARAEAMADLAMCHLRRGALDEASALAENAMAIVTRASLRGFNVTRPRVTLAEVRLALMERDRDRATMRAARQACRGAFAQARVDRSAAPAAFRMWGTWLSLRGRSRRARAWWRKAVNEATALGAPFETALARRLLAGRGAHDRSTQ